MAFTKATDTHAVHNYIYAVQLLQDIIQLFVTKYMACSL